MPGPCSWPVDHGCAPPPTDADPAAAARYDTQVQAATYLLWALSGRAYGVCETRVRPCSDPAPSWANAPWSTGNSGWMVPYLDGGTWRNLACGCAGACQLAGPQVVHLPGRPQQVLSVTVDGQELAEGWWLTGSALVRTGPTPWPTAQNLLLPPTEPGTWEVQYLYGTPPPPGAAQAVGVLTKELLAACAGSTACRLPKRVQSVSRQGVSMSFLDPMSEFAEGRTGIPEVDLWLAAVNPHRLTTPSVVSSPDVNPAW